MRTAYEALLNRLEDLKPSNWNQRLARWISDILSPPVFGLAGILLLNSSQGTLEDWLWSWFYISVAVVIPVLFLIYLVRKGKITDFHMRVRQQRIVPMLFMIACSIFAWGVMQIAAAVVVIRIIALAGSLLMVFMLLITFWWKISGHSTAVSAFSVFCIGCFGPIALPVLLLVPVVVWSRLYLKRHSWGQTLAGLATGSAFMVYVLLSIALHCGGVNLSCG